MPDMPEDTDLPPEKAAASKTSRTAPFLRAVLGIGG